MTRTCIDNGSAGATLALLNSGADFDMCDLYQITLSGGAVLRYTNAQTSQTFLGNTYLAGPVFQRGNLSHKTGTAASTFQITIAATAADTIAGKAFIPYVLALGFDGAAITVYRAFLAKWSTGIVGAINDFTGVVSTVNTITRASLQITVSDPRLRFTVNMPSNVYQSSCANVFCDPNCTLVAATYTTAGAVLTGFTPTALTFWTNSTKADGYYTQGIIKFTSGACSGQARTVSTFANAHGLVKLIYPLPASPAIGDTFTMRAGCDHTLATCKTKFAADNSINFRGQPFIPAAETVY